MSPLFRVMFLALIPLPALLAAEPSGGWDQTQMAGPVTARLRMVSRPLDVGSPLVIRLEVTMPSLPLSEALATGQPARYHPEPEFREWRRVLHLPLADTQENANPGKETTSYQWTCRWEPGLPGNYTLPALRIRHHPLTPETGPLETVFAAIPVQVNALVPGDMAMAAKPRPVIAKLPPAQHAVPGWLLLLLGMAVGGAAGFGYARVRRSRSQARAVPGRDPRQAALARLSQAATRREAYRVLRDFLRETAGIDLARVAGPDLGDHPRLSEPARRLLPALVAELHAGAFSSGDAPLSPESAQRLQELLRAAEA